MPLIDTGVINRWYCDEQSGTAVNDSVGTRDMAHAGSGVSKNLLTPNQFGVDFTTPGGDGRAITSAAGHELNGAQQWTLELVYTVRSISAGSDSWMFGLQDGGDYGPLAVFCETGNFNMFLRSPGSNITFDFNMVGAGRQIIHIVVDTPQAADVDRVKWYRNGVLGAITSSVWPAQNSSLSISASDNLTLGNNDSGSKGINAICHYAALYQVAMPPLDVANNASVLDASDDAPIENEPPDKPTITATPVGSDVDLASSPFSDPDPGDQHASSRWRIYKIP